MPQCSAIIFENDFEEVTMMYDKILVFANDPSAGRALLSGARALAAQVLLLSSNPSLSGADDIFCYPEDASLVSVLPAVLELIGAEKPSLVLCEQSPDGKLLAGMAAAALHTSPLCDVTKIDCAETGVEAKHMVFGGSAFETQKTALPAVIVAAAGAFEDGEPAGAGRRGNLAIPKAPAAELVNIRCSTAAKPVNLSAAKRVIGVGRGLSSADNLPLVEKLAAALGAEIGCTRPAAEEEHWYPKERYIGVSGCMLKPNLYLALGISGQVQHMVGVNQAGTIFAVDKNEHAPIFQQADYCLVGDLNQILPRLAELLGQ